MNRRAFLAGVGATMAGGLVSRSRDRDESEECNGAVLESWSIRKGVLRLHVTGAMEDEMVRVTWQADGERWTTTHSVTEYRADGWHYVGDLEGSDVGPALWTEAVPVSLEVRG